MLLSTTGRCIRRNFWCALVAAVIVVGANGSASAQIKVSDLIGGAVSEITAEYKDVEKAITFFTNGDLVNARKSLIASKKKHPQLAPADVMLAQLLIAAKQGTAAHSLLEQAVTDDPDDPEAYLMLGDLAFRQNQLAAADALFSRGQTLCATYSRNEKRKRSMQIRSLAGLAAVAERRGAAASEENRKKHWRQVETLLSTWLKMDDENTVALTRLGRAEFHLGKDRDAYQTFQKAFKINESGPRPEINMALLYEQAGKRDNAKKLMELAIDRAPNALKTRLAVAQWAIEAGLLDMAKENARAAARLDDDSPQLQLQAKLLVGLVARLENDLDTAEKIFDALHTKSPDSFAVVNHLALTLIDQSDPEKHRRAREFAQLNVRSYSDLRTTVAREAAVTLAWIQFKMDLDKEADRVLQAVLQSRGNLSAESAYHAAAILYDRGGIKAATRILEPLIDAKRVFVHRDDAAKLLEKLRKADSKSSKSSKKGG